MVLEAVPRRQLQQSLLLHLHPRYQVEVEVVLSLLPQQQPVLLGLREGLESLAEAAALLRQTLRQQQVPLREVSAVRDGILEEPLLRVAPRHLQVSNHLAAGVGDTLVLEVMERQVRALLLVRVAQAVSEVAEVAVLPLVVLAASAALAAS